jgi:LysM repeat protein
MKRHPLRLLGLLLVAFLALMGSALSGRAQAGDAYSLIDAVNSLRASNGLPAYEIDPILMAIAQGHSDYQSAIGQVTHIGPGGSHPKDRAMAAGYGNGGSFFISENIAGGTDLSVQGAISMWLGDDPHIQTMLGSSYRNAGAGVAESGGFVYYTLDVASGSGGNYSPPSNTQAISTPGGPTAIPIYRVQTAVPNPNGSIIHVVLSGQTLIGIAEAYGVTVNEIKELNYLTNDVIYEGDKLIIRTARAAGPTSTETATQTPTRVASPTRKPTRTPTATPTPMITTPTTPTASLPQAASIMGSDQVGNILVVAIVVLAGGGVILMVVGSFIKAKPKG